MQHSLFTLLQVPGIPLQATNIHDAIILLSVAITLAFLIFYQKHWNRSKNTLIAYAQQRGLPHGKNKTHGDVLGYAYTFGATHTAMWGKPMVEMHLEVKGLPTSPLTEFMTKGAIGYPMGDKIWNIAPMAIVGEVGVWSEDEHFLVRLIEHGFIEMVMHHNTDDFVVVIKEDVLYIRRTELKAWKTVKQVNDAREIAEAFIKLRSGIYYIDE